MNFFGGEFSPFSKKQNLLKKSVSFFFLNRQTYKLFILNIATIVYNLKKGISFKILYFHILNIAKFDYYAYG
jgi:hypothetical protein